MFTPVVGHLSTGHKPRKFLTNAISSASMLFIKRSFGSRENPETHKFSTMPFAPLDIFSLDCSLGYKTSM